MTGSTTTIKIKYNDNQKAFNTFFISFSFFFIKSLKRLESACNMIIIEFLFTHKNVKKMWLKNYWMNGITSYLLRMLHTRY